MVTGRIRAIQPAVEQERRIKNRPDHVIQMADEGVEGVNMGIFQDGQRVVVLKVAVEGREVAGQGDHEQERN